jgi:hypothetical protein
MLEPILVAKERIPFGVMNMAYFGMVRFAGAVIEIVLEMPLRGIV